MIDRLRPHRYHDEEILSMEHTVERFGNPLPQPGTLLAVFITGDESEGAIEPIKRIFARGLADRSFAGRGGERVVFTTQEMGTVCFYGVDPTVMTLHDIRDLVHDAITEADKHTLGQVTFAPLPQPSRATPAYVYQQALVQSELSTYRFDHYRRIRAYSPVTRINWYTPALRDTDIHHAVKIAGAIRTARDLINEPPNILTPLEMVRRARRIAEEQDLRVTLRSTGNLIGFGGITAVSRGSKNAPFVMVLSYEPTSWEHRVALVGKGITFDSGGLSLKSTEGMLPMKNDMAGAASILALMQVIRDIAPPFAVDAILMLADNKTGADALELGSVIRPYG
ncbi:MAG: hypothetical protein COV67_09275, partial [Nitrospinae bacterium CG11_big_fil_rev_8_21_14_0_20_56_8]